MSAIPGRKREFGRVRRLDHHAVDTRLAASLADVERLSKEAGLDSEDVVTRLRAVLLPTGSEPAVRRSGPAVRRRILLATAAVAAVLAGVALAFLPADPEAAAAPSPASTPGADVIEVAGFAELFLAVYLGSAGEGAEDLLEPYLSQPVRLTGLAPGRTYVQNLTTLSVVPVGDGWEVVVVAHTLTKVAGGYGEPSIEQYLVDVGRGGGELRATTTPTLVAREAV